MSSNQKILPSLRKAWERKRPRSRKRVPYPPDYYPGGNYLNLEIGQMRYWLMGPEDGKRIVFVPGHGVPCPIFRDVARSLASRGFRILLFDLYGRGYSESPPLPHNPLLYTTQLGMLMHQIGFGSANIVGLSLGGGITIEFARRYPQLVQNIILLAPSGLMDETDASSFAARVLGFPWVGEALVNSITMPLIEKLIRHRLKSNQPLMNEIAEILIYQFKNHPGYLRSLTATLRDYPITGQEEVYKKVGDRQRRDGYKVMAFWGTADNTVPYSGSESLIQMIPDVEFIPLPGKDHNIAITDATTITEHIHRFLS